MGAALEALGLSQDAAQSARQALQLKPDSAEAHQNLANALQSLGDNESALQHCRKALELKPDLVEAHATIGIVLESLDRSDEALASYDTAIRLKPNFALPRNNKGLLCLSLARLTEGWRLMEEQWRLEPSHIGLYPQPRWDGGHVRGTLLAWGEQGLGDQIIYATMLDELADRADELVIQVDPRLVPLFRRSFQNARVVPHEPHKLYDGRIDAQSAFTALGPYLRGSRDAFPRRDRGHLVADAARAQALRQRLTSTGYKLIGLSWISRSKTIGSDKSAQLRDLEPVLRLPGCRFVDLQYGDTQAERQAVEREFGIRVERLPDIDTTNDIDGLAALMTACDAVVSVSNTNAHLAGAVGTPTWVMVPLGRAKIWYWFREELDSPWYPRVRVRRLMPEQTWRESFAVAASEVRTFLKIG
jgi:tetratricopeptide (TPR) repeat protein